jgi:hypothetical protein
MVVAVNEIISNASIDCIAPLEPENQVTVCITGDDVVKRRTDDSADVDERILALPGRGAIEKVDSHTSTRGRVCNHVERTQTFSGFTSTQCVVPRAAHEHLPNRSAIPSSSHRSPCYAVSPIPAYQNLRVQVVNIPATANDVVSGATSDRI